MEDVFIYIIIDPRSEKVIYVGKTKQPSKRFYSHTTTSQKTAIGASIKEIIKSGKKPIFNIIEKCTYGQGFDREKFWIDHYFKINPDIFNRPCGAKRLKELPYIMNVLNGINYVPE